MESFYKKWLIKNKEENEKAKKVLNIQNKNLPQQVPPARPLETPIPSTSTSVQSATTATTSSTTNVNLLDASNIVFENEHLKLYIEQRDHIKQIKF